MPVGGCTTAYVTCATNLSVAKSGVSPAGAFGGCAPESKRMTRVVSAGHRYCSRAGSDRAVSDLESGPLGAGPGLARRQLADPGHPVVPGFERVIVLPGLHRGAPRRDRTGPALVLPRRLGPHHPGPVPKLAPHGPGSALGH